MIENVTFDFIRRLHIPIVITDSNGYIIWYNESMGVFIEGIDIYKKSISALTQNRLSIELFHDKKTETILLFDKNFLINFYHLSSNGSNLNIFTFNDITAEENLRQELIKKDPAVAYFIIDNLDDITQKMQDIYRYASGEIALVLKDFINSCGGIYKEYEKDKYLCMFENKDLKTFIKNKFNILDTIREVKIEELNMSVTISGGVSNISGTLEEKEAAARQALELALQRGGDQVVVKSHSSIEFYGGKTKTVQKKTKVKSRVVSNEMASLIKGCSNIIIMGHKFADNDSIGACIGMARFAFHHGYKPKIVLNIHDRNIKSAFMKLRGIEEYKDVFQDETTALDSITPETLLIIVDVNNPVYFESEDIYKNVYKTVIIDHHRKTSEFEKKPDINYIEPGASSASELVSEILEQALPPGSLLKEESELLLAGIILDTMQFTRNTGTRTFSAALYLRGEGGSPSEAISMFKTNLEEFVREARFESNITIYKNNIAISVYEQEALQSDKTAGAKAADRILCIDGVNASFVVFKIDETIHISARSLGSVNVQVILESFGGGGHFDVAGAQIKNSNLKDVVVQLKKAIDEYFEIK